jgi:3-hydroxybutyryl-CoA dehydrogenase
MNTYTQTPGTLLPAGGALPVHRRVVVLGAGTMGCGIAEVAALAGHEVTLCDTSAAAVERGLGLVRASLARQLARGHLAQPDHNAAVRRIQAQQDDGVQRDTGLVIEAIHEELAAKVTAIQRLEPLLDAESIIASNTSSLSITALAARLARPERVVGMHFFNPATRMPLVEVVCGAATAPEVASTIMATARAWGKSPVPCKSTPGFIVNRIARPFYGEALRLLAEQAATPATLDALLREAGGFRMGPCELMDMIGHDVNLAVTKSVYASFFHDPRYQPSLVQQELVDAGWLGRKSGRGFYGYGEGAPRPLVEEAAGGQPLRKLTLPSLGDPLTQALGLVALGDVMREASPNGSLPRVDGHAFALTDGRSATQRSHDLGEPVVLVDWALDFASCTRVALATPAQASTTHLCQVVALFAACGKQVSILADLPGMAVARTVAMLVNEASDAVLQGVARPEDVDLAMQLGVNYPLGPIAWGRKIGWARVQAVLDHLRQTYGEDRYRTSVWLRQEALATNMT